MRNYNFLLSALVCSAVCIHGSTAAPPAIKSLPLKVVAGKYVRSIAGRPGTVIVKEAGKDKVEISIEASRESPKPASAKVSAILPITKNIAVLTKKTKGGEYSISMRFSEHETILIYTGTGFGAVGVDPSGVYAKQEAASSK